MRGRAYGGGGCLRRGTIIVNLKRRVARTRQGPASASHAHGRNLELISEWLCRHTDKIRQQHLERATASAAHLVVVEHSSRLQKSTNNLIRQPTTDRRRRRRSEIRRQRSLI